MRVGIYCLLQDETDFKDRLAQQMWPNFFGWGFALRDRFSLMQIYRIIECIIAYMCADMYHGYRADPFARLLGANLAYERLRCRLCPKQEPRRIRFS